MANDIEICNLALTRVGANLIVSFADSTVEAQNCNALYGFARDAVLRDHDWAFARKHLALTLLAETNPDWLFVYAGPADCMAARRIHNPHTKEARHAIAFETGLAASGNSTTVLTNKENAILVYTAKVLNSAAWDSTFCDALGWRLAAELVQPLRGDSQLSNQIRLICQIKAAFNNLTSLDVQVQTATDAAFTTPVILEDVNVLLAGLTAGAIINVPSVTRGYLRYIRFYYVVNGTAPTTGSVYAGVVLDQQANISTPNELGL